MTRLCDLKGVWRRSLIIGADGARDDTTSVIWLQGASVYVDLRKPKTHLCFGNARTLRDLDATQIEALAQQEGFAGTLFRHSDHFEWTRKIDFQPPQPHADRGTLLDLGHVMVEEGYQIPYVEHWHRETSGVKAGALTLQDVETGCPGMILHVGNCFAFARGRAHVLSEPGNLLDKVRKASSLEAAQNLIDCEVSIGTTFGNWRIKQSTLPYRECTELTPRLSGQHLMMADVTPKGRPYERVWTVVAQEGLFNTSS